MNGLRTLQYFRIDAWWQVLRQALIWLCLSLAVILAFFALLATMDWLLIVFPIDPAGSYVIFLVTAVVLFLFRPLYRWARDFVDYLFFPDTASIMLNIDAACRNLTKVDTRFQLEQLLTRQLPAQLQVDYISLNEDSSGNESAALRLPLEMSERSLGALLVGPKCSGRSFIAEEVLAFKQLQEQVSLLLSVMQLEEAREEAERTDELKNNFLTNISHELRTPLNSVINATGLVADGVLGSITGEQEEFLRRAVSGSEYLMSLLDDILDITRIETGELTLHLDVVELREVIQDVLPLVRGMLQNKDVKLRIEVADDLPLMVADRLRVRQILLNILSNAAKFTQRGHVWVKATQEGDRILVRVEDTGIGIAQEDQSLIFQDYQQILSQKRDVPTERRRHIGTGLGMPITRALVELHGGQIRVQSELGQGATFIITLPKVLFSTKKIG